MKKNLVNIKKIMLIILAIAMLSVFFSGCTQNGGENKDWAYIEKKGTLKIGITYFAPMNYIETEKETYGKKGELVGFETEFAKAVCAEIGITPEFMEINWETKEVDLAAKKIDCIWNGMTISDDRKANMSISRPYMNNKQVLIVKKENISDLGSSVEGKKIVAEMKSAGETVAYGNKTKNIDPDQFFKNIKFTAVDTQAKALLEVKSGTADGAVVDYVLSIGSIGEGTDFSDLAIVDSREFAKEEYGIAFRKNDSELTKKVNETIKKLIDNGTLKEIAKKYKLEEQIILK